MTVVTGAERWRMGATELAHVVTSGQASSREAVEAHLRRIESALGTAKVEIPLPRSMRSRE